MAWPTVTAQNIADRWRPLSPEEQTVAGTRIADAEAELQYQLRLRGLIDPPTDPSWAVMYTSTVVEIVRRYLLNPEGWSSETESLDDYSATRRRDGVDLPVYVMDVEIDRLIPRVRPRRGAFTIRLGSS